MYAPFIHVEFLSSSSDLNHLIGLFIIPPNGPSMNTSHLFVPLPPLPLLILPLLSKNYICRLMTRLSAFPPEILYTAQHDSDLSSAFSQD